MVEIELNRFINEFLSGKCVRRPTKQRVFECSNCDPNLCFMEAQTMWTVQRRRKEISLVSIGRC